MLQEEREPSLNPLLLDATTASRTTIKTRTQQIVNTQILTLIASRKLPGHAMRELSPQEHNTTCSRRTRDRSGCARMIGREYRRRRTTHAARRCTERLDRPPTETTPGAATRARLPARYPAPGC